MAERRSIGSINVMIESINRRTGMAN